VVDGAKWYEQAVAGKEPISDFDTEFKIDIKFTLRKPIPGKVKARHFGSVPKKGPTRRFGRALHRQLKRR